MKPLVAAFLLLALLPLGAQDIDSCFCFPNGLEPRGYYEWHNGDSVAIDTCGHPWPLDVCEGVSLPWTYDYKHMYARRGFTLIFDVDAIKLPPLPHDTVIAVTWQAIDTTYPELRNGIRNLSEEIAPFIMTKIYPQYGTGPHSRGFRVKFDRYVEINAVDAAIHKIPLVDLELPFLGLYEVAVPEASVPQEPFLTITPNPATEYLAISRRLTSTIIPSTDIILRDIHGRIVGFAVFSTFTSSITIPVSHLPSGIYLFQYHTFFQPLVIMR